METSITKPPMDADQRRCSLDAVTEAVIGAAYRVSNSLGCGFLEKVYENALSHELRKGGYQVQQQHLVNVRYDNVVVGHYVADLVVQGDVIVEVKAIRCVEEVHLAQCLNYLKATGKPVCLLLNFSKPKVEVKRMVNNF